MTTLNDAFEGDLSQEDEGYESGSESLNIPTPLRRAAQLYHISTSKYISFDPTTAAQHPEHTSRRLRSCSSVWHHFTFSSSNEESPTPDSSTLHRRAEPPSLAQHHMDYQHTPTPDTDNSSRMLQMKKIFPQLHWMVTFGLKIQFQRDICVFMNSHSHISHVSIPVHTSLTCYPPLQKMLQYHDAMDLSDISDFQDVMMTTSDEEIPDLDDVFGL